MAVAALTQNELSQLKAALGAKAMEQTALMNASISTPDTVPEEFCTVWAKAGPVLKVVVQFIGIIPGVGTGAAAIINALIAALDSLSSTVCPKTS